MKSQATDLEKPLAKYSMSDKGLVSKAGNSPAESDVREDQLGARISIPTGQ